MDKGDGNNQLSIILVRDIINTLCVVDRPCVPLTTALQVIRSSLELMLVSKDLTSLKK